LSISNYTQLCPIIPDSKIFFCLLLTDFIVKYVINQNKAVEKWQKKRKRKHRKKRHLRKIR
jgi:hypothetical protein